MKGPINTIPFQLPFGTAVKVVSGSPPMDYAIYDAMMNRIPTLSGEAEVVYSDVVSDMYSSVARLLLQTPDGFRAAYVRDPTLIEILTKAPAKLSYTPDAAELALRHLPGFTVGCDPEVIVTTPEGALPAWEFLPAKTTPVREGNANVFWDGVQAEMAFTTSISCLDTLAACVSAGLNAIQRQAKAHTPTATIGVHNVIRVPQETLLRAKDEHVALGCSPSFNVYGLSGALAGDPRYLPYRFAGYHFHSGIAGTGLIPEVSHTTIAPIIRALDASLGCLSVAASEGYESPIRRQYYGLAGEYRLPKHGFEYRTIAPAFPLCDPSFHHLAWEVFRLVTRLASRGMFWPFWNAEESEVVEGINTTSPEICRGVINRNLPFLARLLHTKVNFYGDLKASAVSSQLSRLVNEGIGAFVANPHNVVQNWVYPGEPNVSRKCGWRFGDAIRWLTTHPTSTIS